MFLQHDDTPQVSLQCPKHMSLANLRYTQWTYLSLMAFQST